MPYKRQHFEREIINSFNNVVVYHDYDEDESGRRLLYHYTTSPSDDAKAFDVRELSTWKKHEGVKDDYIRGIRAIRDALASGELKEDPIT